MKNLYKIASLIALLMACTFSVQAQTRVCKGEQVCLTVPSHRGGVQWQSSSDSVSWSNLVPGNQDTICFAADTSSYYRAIVTEGSCAPVISSMSHVEVFEVTADAGADAAFCTGFPVSIGGAPSGSGGFGSLSYMWTPTTGLSSGSVPNPTVSLTVPVSYVLQVTDSLGCTALDTINLDTNGTSAPPGTTTFTYTGAPQMFVVPGCVTSITAIVEGAQGGANWVNNVNFGGSVTATIPVTPGETLYVYVGQQPTVGTTAGWNGGGAGDGGGKGGGGGSDIRQGGQTLNDRVLVGGGGGGAGYWSNLHVVGGVGGGLVGGNGYRDAPSTPGGLGGTQSAAGANGTCASFNNPNMAGAFGQGGTPLGFNCGCEGYGGGGGWYGGAGSGNCRGGGGGSGYAAPNATNVTHASGVRVGNGQVTISW